MFQKVLALGGLCLIVGCSSQIDTASNVSRRNTSSSKSGIIGGQFVKEGSAIAKSTVGIYDLENDFSCTGTLLTENIVITAAHCLEGKAESIKIIFDLEISFSLNSTDNKVRKKHLRNGTAIYIHPQWDNTGSKKDNWNDIALLYFTEGLPEGYAPVKKLTDTGFLQVGRSVTIAGFGVTKVTATNINEKKHPPSEKDITNGDVVCDESEPEEKLHCYKIEFLGDDDLLFTTAKIGSLLPAEVRLDESLGHGTCVGDSGGPAFLEIDNVFYFFGITSRGSYACDGYGIYTNTLFYKEWIDNTVSLISKLSVK